MAGLAFGYHVGVGQQSTSVHPWAWLVDPSTSTMATVALGSTGLLVAAYFSVSASR